MAEREAELFDALSDLGLRLCRIFEGTYSGEICCRPGTREAAVAEVPLPVPDGLTDGDGDGADPAAQTVAAALLESLLDADQLAQYRTEGTFWVETTRGRVRLGRLFDLAHVTPGGEQRSLCVVPDVIDGLPDGDIWVTLLLWLQTDPDRFFRVAVSNDVPVGDRSYAETCTIGVAEPADVQNLLLAELDRVEAPFLGYQEPQPPLASGIEALDDVICCSNGGKVVVVVGAPGAGKSAFVLGTACRTAARFGLRRQPRDPEREHVLLWDPLSDHETLVRHIVANESLIAREDLWRSRLSDAEFRRLSDTYGRIAAIPLCLRGGPSDGMDWKDVVPVGRRIRLVVIDHATAVCPDLATTLGASRDLARAHDAVVVVTVTVGGQGPEPLSASLLSGPLVECPDFVVAIEDRRPPSRPNRAVAAGLKNLSVLKNRLGPKAVVPAVLVESWGRLLPVVSD